MEVREVLRGIRLAARDLVKHGFQPGMPNRVATNAACEATNPRPRPFSLWSEKPKPTIGEGPVGDYTTWPMLTDRAYSARHLPPVSQSYMDALVARAPDAAYDDSDPDRVIVGEMTKLFAREGEMTPSRSSLLFMFFAQWFTDSILRVNPHDRRTNTSNHNIDLCQIYGRSETSARALRAMSGGKLKHRVLENGQVYQDTLIENPESDDWRVKPEYRDLPYTSDKAMRDVFTNWLDDPTRRRHIYATGLERGNSSIGYSAINTIFLREHNAICDALKDAYPDWDDERLFQTARLINTVILMKLVVVDYINHIRGDRLFEFDTEFAEDEPWYRAPWITLEFDLLYRWHGMVPDHIAIGGVDYDHEAYRFNNGLLEAAGLETVISETSRQAAGRIPLGNVPAFLLGAEYHNINMGRAFRLQPYNAYREKFGLRPVTSFTQLTKDPGLRAKLEEAYGDIDKVELVIGLFAEDASGQRLFGDLMNAMVAFDAFTQIYTNPLLSRNVYNERTLSRVGLDRIATTNAVQDLVDRNTSGGALAMFDMPDRA